MTTGSSRQVSPELYDNQGEPDRDQDFSERYAPLEDVPVAEGEAVLSADFPVLQHPVPTAGIVPTVGVGLDAVAPKRPVHLDPHYVDIHRNGDKCGDRDHGNEEIHYRPSPISDGLLPTNPETTIRMREPNGMTPTDISEP